MFRALFSLLILTGILFCSSCRKDFAYRESEGRLEFSKDTVFLDTIFTNIGSSTYTLKVYNRTGDDIIIPSVALEQGLSSSYRLNVDGVAGKVFDDVTILARDSIFIFIETTFDISQLNQNEFLYTDLLQFVSSSSTQQVPLVTLIKDAIFLFPSELSDGTKETIPIGLDNEGNEIRVFYLGGQSNMDGMGDLSGARNVYTGIYLISDPAIADGPFQIYRVGNYKVLKT